MSRKLRVGIVFGGRSAEHEVSLQSAQNVIAYIDRTRFEPVLIGIGRDGNWVLSPAGQPFLGTESPEVVRLNDSPTDVALLAGKTNGALIRLETPESVDQLDVLFPVLHGPTERTVRYRGWRGLRISRVLERTSWGLRSEWTKTSPSDCFATPVFPPRTT